MTSRRSGDGTRRGGETPLPFPSDAPPPSPGSRSRPLTVAALNLSVQRRIEREHPSVWIVGEISNLARYSSGHLYFTIKDADSEISSVMFASANRRLRTPLADGMEVLACGHPTLYVPRGRYQFVVEEAEPRGRGSLLEAFEALKQRLLAEGLFDPSRKRAIPVLPSRIGIVTSPDGAALRDILKVLRRRHAGLGVVLAPVRVQGDGAAEEIAGAIAALGRLGGIDVLIVGRGGGSIEDLWAFNEEIVARAIAASPIPVIAAVGHETDVTIADFAADLRAATPSHAAELVVASREDLAAQLDGNAARLLGAWRLLLAGARARHERLERRSALAEFPSRLAARGQQLDDLAGRLPAHVDERLGSSRRALRELSIRLAPRHLLEVVRRRHAAACDLDRRLGRVMTTSLRAARSRAGASLALLQSLSPLQVLQRGYAICLDPATGAVLSSSAGVVAGDAVHVQLARGALDCRVEAAHKVHKESA